MPWCWDEKTDRVWHEPDYVVWMRWMVQNRSGQNGVGPALALYEGKRGVRVSTIFIGWESSLGLFETSVEGRGGNAALIRHHTPAEARAFHDEAVAHFERGGTLRSFLREHNKEDV